MYISKEDLDVDLVSMGKNKRSDEIFKSTLTHPETGVTLQSIIGLEGRKSENTFIKVLVKNEQGFIEEEFEFGGKYNETEEDFVNATNKFEEEIKKRLPEEEQETSQPETFKEMPKIGDIVRIGKEYGEVMVADEATRNIEITPLSKEDALKMVKDDN